MAEPGLITLKMRDRDQLMTWSKVREQNDSPFYAALLRAIAEDDALFTLAMEAPPEQLGGRLLLAAVHYLLLKGARHALADCFPSLADDPRPAADAAPLFRAFCVEHRDELAEILRTRTLQTTSSGRAVQVLLALDQVARSIGAPFSLVEVGCSAGLLLLFDHYRYRFPDDSSLGEEDAEVVVSSFEFAGEQPAAPARFPEIVRRVGLDLNPVDVTDPDALLWILGCTAADRVQEFRSLRRALRYRSRQPLEVVAGDAMQSLPRVLEQIPGPVCVFHSRCLYQWPSPAQAAFSAMLERLSRDRIIHRLGIERQAAIDPADITGGGTNEIVHNIYRQGRGEMRLLGRIARKDVIAWLV